MSDATSTVPRTRYGYWVAPDGTPTPVEDHNPHAIKVTGEPRGDVASQKALAAGHVRVAGGPGSQVGNPGYLYVQAHHDALTGGQRATVQKLVDHARGQPTHRIVLAVGRNPAYVVAHDAKPAVNRRVLKRYGLSEGLTVADRERAAHAHVAAGRLSPAAHAWVHHYQLGYNKPLKRPPKLTDPVLAELSAYKPAGPVTLHRAHAAHGYEHESWTHDRAFAQHLVDHSDGKRKLVTRTFHPHEIVADTTRLPHHEDDGMKEVVVAVKGTPLAARVAYAHSRRPKPPGVAEGRGADPGTMTCVLRLKALAAKVGASLDVRDRDLTVDAPRGYAWRANGGTTISAAAENSGQAWWRQACGEVEEYMRHGLDKCDPGHAAEIAHDRDEPWDAPAGAPDHLRVEAVAEARAAADDVVHDPPAKEVAARVRRFGDHRIVFNATHVVMGSAYHYSHPDIVNDLKGDGDYHEAFVVKGRTGAHELHARTVAGGKALLKHPVAARWAMPVKGTIMLNGEVTGRERPITARTPDEPDEESVAEAAVDTASRHKHLTPDAYKRVVGMCPDGFRWTGTHCAPKHATVHARGRVMKALTGRTAPKLVRRLARYTAPANPAVAAEPPSKFDPPAKHAAGGSAAGRIAKHAGAALAKPFVEAYKIATNAEARHHALAFAHHAIATEAKETADLVRVVGKALSGGTVSPQERANAINQTVDLVKMAVGAALVAHMASGGLAQLAAELASPADDVVGIMMDGPVRRITSKYFGPHHAHGLLPSAFYESPPQAHGGPVAAVVNVPAETPESAAADPLAAAVDAVVGGVVEAFLSRAGAAKPPAADPKATVQQLVAAIVNDLAGEKLTPEDKAAIAKAVEALHARANPPKKGAKKESLDEAAFGQSMVDVMTARGGWVAAADGTLTHARYPGVSARWDGDRFTFDGASAEVTESILADTASTTGEAVYGVPDDELEQAKRHVLAHVAAEPHAGLNDVRRGVHARAASAGEARPSTRAIKRALSHLSADGKLRKTMDGMGYKYDVAEALSPEDRAASRHLYARLHDLPKHYVARPEAARVPGHRTYGIFHPRVSRGLVPVTHVHVPDGTTPRRRRAIIHAGVHDFHKALKRNALREVAEAKVRTAGPYRPVPPTPTTRGSKGDYVYHATNDDRARDIAADGRLHPHRPWHGTKQREWPDGKAERRSYWHHDAKVVHSFAPDEGRHVILRAPKSAAAFKREHGTGDTYATTSVHARHLHVLTDKGWVPLRKYAGTGPWAAGGTRHVPDHKPVGEGADGVFDVFIDRQYFPAASRSTVPGKEHYEAWPKVRAASREEAARKVWAAHGARLLKEMAPRATKLPRKVSLNVSGARGTAPGRMTPVTVYVGEGTASAGVGGFRTATLGAACPKCGSANVGTLAEFVNEDRTRSARLRCRDCGHAWSAKVAAYDRAGVDPGGSDRWVGGEDVDEARKAPAADPPDPDDDEEADLGFTLGDVQDYVDMQVLHDKEPDQALALAKKKFGVRDLTMSPVGKVESPSVPDGKAVVPPQPPFGLDQPGGGGGPGADAPPPDATFPVSQGGDQPDDVAGAPPAAAGNAATQPPPRG